MCKTCKYHHNHVLHGTLKVNLQHYYI
uniref:Uncharacterized protein n=1 Tax=Arundo donax TaxID=35708 RepID=A0A0A9AUT4_ARUDO